MMHLFALFLLIVSGVVYASHFRGGSMSWRAINNGQQVEVTYRVGFKFYHNEPQFEPCTEQAQQARTVLGTDGDLHCDKCVGYDTVKPFKWICDDFDAEQDWATGGNIVVYDVPPGQTTFIINHQNCCWLKLVSPDTGGGGRGWNLITEVNVQPRPDIGRINSSPVSAPIPLEKFYRGCTYNLQIAVTDPDNDLVKCRYMKTDECPDPSKHWNRACGAATHGLTVNKNCSMVFDTKGVEQGYHAVNIIILDCPNGKCKTPYSKTPLLFLLNVADDSSQCMKPSIIIPPSCKAIAPGNHFEMIVMAEAGDPSKPISKISSQKPFGMTASPMRAVSGHPNRKAVTLSWIPSANQMREHTLCFSALDSDGYTSGRSCTFIVVTDQPQLSPDPGASTPAEGAKHDVREPWIIRFGAEIQRPRRSANIHILDKEGAIVYSVDVKKDEVVYHRDALEFHPPQDSFPFSIGDAIPYKIHLDEGVAVPSYGGGCLSEESEWGVYIKDNTDFAILPKENCKSSVGMMVDPGTCDVFLKQVTLDENNKVIPTDYNLCCSCVGPAYNTAGYPPGLPGPPGAPAPPGPPSGRQ